MFKGKIRVTAALMLSAAALAGCQGDVTLDNVGDKISESVSDTITKTKEQVRSELKNAFVNEVQEFIANGDLAETLGISVGRGRAGGCKRVCRDIFRKCKGTFR